VNLPPTDNDVKLAEVACIAGCVCLTSVTFLVVLLRSLFFHWSWWWCATPLVIALIVSTGVGAYYTLFAGRKGRHARR
jgi:hypothetical protein